MLKPLALIGYSGHAYVILDVFTSQNRNVSAYCDKEKKQSNPYSLTYLGSERQTETTEKLKLYDYFIGIGDNESRQKVYEYLINFVHLPCNAIHSSAIISSSAQLSHGIMASAKTVVNAQSNIGKGVILNTGCIVEHECRVDDFCHIAPSAILCGNVRVGTGSFVGANSVVKQNITIGKNVVIGAGSVIITDIPDNSKVIGNPSRFI